MSTSSFQPVLPFPLDPTSDDRTFVTPTLWFVDRDGYRVVFCRHEPICRGALDDRPHLRYVCVMLRQSQLASQDDLARAFGHSVATQRRWERRYQQLGLDGLVDHFSSGRPCKLDNSQDRRNHRPPRLPTPWPAALCHARGHPTFGCQQVLSVFQNIYGSLHPSFYGLRTLVLTLHIMALLRIKRPENLKEYSPTAFGRVLGLDRAPEVKTVRRKLSDLANRKQGHQLMEALARQRMARQDEALAFFYVDGHVREYHGQEPLAKTKKPQSPVATTATTDYWVHDAEGSPLLVVTSEMNAALTSVLQPILKQVKTLLPQEQRLTVLFDRGGFSARLFRLLIDSGFDVITYRKGKKRLLPKYRFHEHTLEIEGRCVKYQLCDQPRKHVGRLRKARKKRQRQESPQFLWMREVTVLRETGGQTQVLTNRTDLAAVQVVHRLFSRWRQENYFKYMEAEVALDALVEYGTEESGPAGDRPNPQRRRVEKRLRKARAEVVRLQAALGEQVEASAKSAQPTLVDFQTAHAELRKQLQAAEACVLRWEQQRERIPKRIPASDLKVLKRDKKYVVDAIKMTAYQIETELLEMLSEDYARAEDEGRRAKGEGRRAKGEGRRAKGEGRRAKGERFCSRRFNRAVVWRSEGMNCA